MRGSNADTVTEKAKTREINAEGKYILFQMHVNMCWHRCDMFSWPPSCSLDCSLLLLFTPILVFFLNWLFVRFLSTGEVYFPLVFSFLFEDHMSMQFVLNAMFFFFFKYIIHIYSLNTSCFSCHFVFFFLQMQVSCQFCLIHIYGVSDHFPLSLSRIFF